MNHLGAAAVRVADTIGNRARVRDERRHGRSTAPVPGSEHTHPLACERPDRRRKPRALALEVPGIPHRRVAVAEVRHTLRHRHGLGARVAARDDEVRRRCPSRLPDERHQRQEPLVMSRRAGDLLEERGPGVRESRHRLRVEQRRQHHRVREGAPHRLDDPLRAAVLHDPLLSDRDPHVSRPGGRRTRDPRRSPAERGSASRRSGA